MKPALVQFAALLSLFIKGSVERKTKAYVAIHHFKALFKEMVRRKKILTLFKVVSSEN